MHDCVCSCAVCNMSVCNCIYLYDIYCTLYSRYISHARYRCLTMHTHIRCGPFISTYRQCVQRDGEGYVDVVTIFCSAHCFFCNHNLLHMPNGFPCHITSIFNTKFSVYRMLCIFEFSLVKTSLEIRSEHERAINCATDDRTENAITTKQSRSFRNNSAGMRNRYSSRHCNGSKQEQQQPNKTPILCATYSSKHTTKHRVSVWKMEIETLQEVGNVPYFSFLSIPCYLFFFCILIFSFWYCNSFDAR